MSQPTENSVAADSAFEIAPYGDVSELLNHSTTRFALIRADGAVIGDLSEDEARLFAAARALLAALKDCRAELFKRIDALTANMAPEVRQVYLAFPPIVSADAAIAKATGADS